MSESVQQAIAALEDYLRRYPSGKFAELAQVRLDKLLAEAGEKKVNVVSLAANPFSKGTAPANYDYRQGDVFKYQVSDSLTNIPQQVRVQRVVEVTADSVIYNGGRMITDLLGNYLRMGNGTAYGPNQFYAAEYSVGKKWSTRYSVAFPRGDPDEIELDFQVTGREHITVLAGTFDAFRVEGSGWTLRKARSMSITYWVAPERAPRVIAIDTLYRRTKGKSLIIKAEREELLAFARGQTAAGGRPG